MTPPTMTTSTSTRAENTEGRRHLLRFSCRPPLPRRRALPPPPLPPPPQRRRWSPLRRRWARSFAPRSYNFLPDDSRKKRSRRVVMKKTTIRRPIGIGRIARRKKKKKNTKRRNARREPKAMGKEQRQDDVGEKKEKKNGTSTRTSRRNRSPLPSLFPLLPCATPLLPRWHSSPAPPPSPEARLPLVVPHSPWTPTMSTLPFMVIPHPTPHPAWRHNKRGAPPPSTTRVRCEGRTTEEEKIAVGRRRRRRRRSCTIAIPLMRPPPPPRFR